MSADQHLRMKSSFHDLLDPSVCSCLSTSSHSIICNQVKWSTVSFITAVLIIIVYATSGLYTLIDVTTLMSMKSLEGNNETILLETEFLSTTIDLRWKTLCVYFLIVLLIIVLICGIQLSRPWLLFIWSILMIIMLVVDGIVTILSLRPDHQQIYRSSQQIRILFFVMIIRLSILLCAIFVTIFHFRGLHQAKLEYINRQRMLHRYNTESETPSCQNSLTRSAAFLIPSKNICDEHYIGDLPSSIPLPRGKVATIQRHPTSTLFRSSLSSHTELTNPYHQRPISENNQTFQYNIPLKQTFHHEKMTGEQELEKYI